MSNYKLPGGVRDVYWTDGGFNENDGSSIQFAKKTFSGTNGAASAVSVIDPPPSLFVPASIVDMSGSRHVESFTIPDNVQVNASFSSIAGVGSGPVIQAGENAQASFLTISTDFAGNSGDIAYDSNGKSRISIDARAMLLNGPNQVGISINGATDQSFANVGQISCRFSGSTGLEITSTGNSPRYYQVNEINANGDNTKGINYDTTATGAATFRLGAITYEDNGSGSGSGNVAVNVEQGTIAGYCVEIDMETAANVGADGDLILDVLLSNGNAVNDGTANFRSARHNGNITNNGTGVYRVDYLNGDLNNTDVCLINSVAMTGDINNSGTLNATIDTHIGTINNTGGINGVINGIKYGFSADSNTRVQSFLRDGIISGSWETIGFLTIDTTNLVAITSIVGSYNQTTINERTMEFRVIDADTNDVYYEGTRTTGGPAERYYQELTPTATPIPSNQVVRLLFQNQRIGPGGVSGGGAQIDWVVS